MCYIDRGLGNAPENAPPELDLPRSLVRDGGVWLDPETATEVSWRLRCYWRWPAACQTVVDAQGEAKDKQIELERGTTQKLLELSTEPQPEGYALSTVLFAGVGGTLFGAAVVAVIVALGR